MVGGHCIKSWSKTLPVLALSSGEAELMSVVKGTTESMGLQALYKDLGMDMKIAVRSDATAAIGIVSRAGFGKVRHLAVADLWVQGAAKRGLVEYTKIPGHLNPADMLTKAVERALMEQHSQTLGQTSIGGRASSAPQRRQEPQAGSSK